MVSGHPDLDAGLRLTLDPNTSVTFDPTAPPVLLPEGVMGPVNSHNTLFHYSALWSVVLPVSEKCDVWRGYWAQRLLWEIGGHLAYLPATAYRVGQGLTLRKIAI